MYTHDSSLDDSIGAWSAGVLDPGEQRSLRERVTTDDAFRAAYRTFITSRLAEVWAPVGDPLLEPEPERPWLIASLPHLGPEQAIEAYRDELGTTWRWPGADPIRAEPRAGLVELAGDVTSGPIRVGLRYAEPSLLDEAWRAVCAARSIATGAVADPARVAILGHAAPKLRARALDDAMRALHALPCPWLRPGVRRAVESAAGSVDPTLGKLLHAALGPRPGAVPVVVVSTTAREGHVLELRVHADEDKARGNMWRRAKEIRPAAQRAVHDGFLAVALRTGTGLPGYAFVQHTFELVRPPDLPDFTVDGDSLALPVAMAFASLWTNVQVPGDLVASARPYGTGVGPVGHVRAKAEAVCRTGGKGCGYDPAARRVAREGGPAVREIERADRGTVSRCARLCVRRAGRIRGLDRDPGASGARQLA